MACCLRNRLPWIILRLVLEGRRIAAGFADRGKSELHRARCCVTRVRLTGIHAGAAFQDATTESATENRQPGASRVMVKRCGKSAPREAQATRHGKPHRVQGQIGNRGAARSAFRESETGFGYRSLRQMILSVPRAGCRQNSAYSLSKTTFHFRAPIGEVTRALNCHPTATLTAAGRRATSSSSQTALCAH